MELVQLSTAQIEWLTDLIGSELQDETADDEPNQERVAFLEELLTAFE